MSVPQTVAQVLSKHVVLEVESIDRMYLNVYVPQLQAVEGTLSSYGSTADIKLPPLTWWSRSHASSSAPSSALPRTTELLLSPLRKDNAKTTLPNSSAKTSATGKASSSSAKPKRNARSIALRNAAIQGLSAPIPGSSSPLPW